MAQVAPGGRGESRAAAVTLWRPAAAPRDGCFPFVVAHTCRLPACAGPVSAVERRCAWARTLTLAGPRGGAAEGALSTSSLQRQRGEPRERGVPARPDAEPDPWLRPAAGAQTGLPRRDTEHAEEGAAVPSAASPDWVTGCGIGASFGEQNHGFCLFSQQCLEGEAGVGDRLAGRVRRARLPRAAGWAGPGAGGGGSWGGACRAQGRGRRGSWRAAAPASAPRSPHRVGGPARQILAFGPKPDMAQMCVSEGGARRAGTPPRGTHS